jgi:hypothetical protein
MVTGLRMNQTVEFLNQMNIATASKKTFYRIQGEVVNPIIWSTWMEMRSNLWDQLRECEMTVTGDGQFDSPGFSAYYCFYTVVESTTNKVCFLLLEVDIHLTNPSILPWMEIFETTPSWGWGNYGRCPFG